MAATGVEMTEKILMCSIYGKVARFRELASAGVTIRPTGEVLINGPLLIELLFGDSYGAFAERAVRSDRFMFLLEPHDATNAGTFDTVAQSFLSSLYSQAIARGEFPKDPPDFYGILAPASRSATGWPVYFFALGTELKLPKEAYRGKLRVKA